MKHSYTALSRGYVRLCALAVLLLCGAGAKAQSYLLPTSGITSVTTCAGTLYDNGGPSAAYSSNAYGGTTLIPATAGNKIRLQFSVFNVDSYYDAVRVYDGSSTTSPLLGTYTNLNPPPASVYATNATGSLTVVLESDSYYTLSGFEAAVSCVTAVPLADLAVQGASANPLSTVAGNSVSLNCSIYNIGGGAAASSNVGYYFSRDAVLDAGDQLLGNSPGSSLNPGSSSSRYGMVTIPATATPGSYYILFVGDYLNQVGESNEANNMAAVNVNVTPPSVDLTLQQANVSPMSTAVGMPIYMNCYILNTGNATANSSSVGFYISTDNVLDAADMLLTSQYGGPLTTIYSTQRSGTAAIPSGLTPGTYYILFAADYQNQVTETNETNNVAAVAITVAPPGVDLVPQQEQLFPRSAAAGGSLQASASILNQGNVLASSSAMGFYLSANTTLDAGDVLLSTVPGSQLGANQSAYRSDYPIVPAGTAPGNYFVLFVADPASAVTETNETNNVRSLSLTVVAPSVDLSISSPYVSPSSLTPGGSATTSFYLYNQGNAPASPANVGFYLSTDNVFSTNDVSVGSQSNATVASGAYLNRTGSVTIPSGTASGTYFLLFVADPLNVLTETNENNNVTFTNIQVVAPGIDLQVNQSYASPFTVGAGATANVTSYIYNTGTLLSPSSTLGYYLSTNSTLDANDVLLSTVAGGQMSAGTSSYRSASVTVPTGTAAGYYFVLVVADPANAVTETNENNNITSTNIQVTVPSIDLQITQVYMNSSSAAPGTSVPVNAYLYNSGNTAASNSNVGYYLSTNTTLDASDVLLTTTTGGSLSGGQGFYSYANVTIPTGTAVGNRYLLAVADPQNGVVETNENNNVGFYQFTVTGPFTGIIVPFNGSNTVTTSGTTVYDHAGYGDYSNNAYGTLTINPGVANSRIQLTFNSFAVEQCCDQLMIYDGPNTQSPLLATLTSMPSLPITASNASGALTLVFVSDGSITASGFDADVTNVAAPLILPDLMFTQVGASPSSVAAGRNLSLSVSIANQGSGSSATSAVGYYLSTNQVLDANDQLLGTSAGSALAASANSARQFTAAVPSNVTPGTYFVLFVADPQNSVTEADESNNMATLGVTVTQALASREQTAGYSVAVAPNPVTTGQPLRVQLTGGVATCAASVDLYNALGQLVSSQALQLGAGRANQAEVATQGLASGVYVLRLTGQNLSVSRRVVIE